MVSFLRRLDYFVFKDRIDRLYNDPDEVFYYICVKLLILKAVFLIITESGVSEVNAFYS